MNHIDHEMISGPCRVKLKVMIVMMKMMMMMIIMMIMMIMMIVMIVMIVMMMIVFMDHTYQPIMNSIILEGRTDN